MAFPMPPGLTPAEVSFLCEMELVTIVPRQRLDSIELLSGRTPALRPPQRADVPLWLALLLKKQRRANIVPPPWLHPASLTEILQHETHTDPDSFSPPPPPPMQANPMIPGSVSDAQLPGFNNGDEKVILSPPFLPSNTASAPAGYLPYHWMEMAELLLANAADDVLNSGQVRRLVRDLQEVRASKIRAGMKKLGGGGGIMSLRGVGAMELAESRGLILGVVDGVRKLGASAEATRRENEEDGVGAGREGFRDDDDDEVMGF